MELLTLLGLVFVTLKLLGVTKVATWSWFWVLSPFLLILLISILAFFYALSLGNNL